MKYNITHVCCVVRYTYMIKNFIGDLLWNIG